MGRKLSKEGERDLARAYGMMPYAERLAEARDAAEIARQFVDTYNANRRDPNFNVPVALFGLYMVIADGARRHAVTASRGFDWGEAIEAYVGRGWLHDVTKAILRHYRMIGRMIRVGSLETSLRRNFKSAQRTGEIVVGVNEKGRASLAGVAESREIEAAYFLVNGTRGAWTGLSPVPDLPLPLEIELMGVELMAPIKGQPELAVRLTPRAAISRDHMNGMQTIVRLARAQRRQAQLASKHENVPQNETRAPKTIYARSLVSARSEGEFTPGFTYGEAFDVLGYLVGTCPVALSAARMLMSYATKRYSAGAPQNFDHLRVCWGEENCKTPAFIANSIADGKTLPNLCPKCRADAETIRKQRERRLKANSLSRAN